MFQICRRSRHSSHSGNRSSTRQQCPRDNELFHHGREKELWMLQFILRSFQGRIASFRRNYISSQWFLQSFFFRACFPNAKTVFPSFVTFLLCIDASSRRINFSSRRPLGSGSGRDDVLQIPLFLASRNANFLSLLRNQRIHEFRTLFQETVSDFSKR